MVTESTNPVQSVRTHSLTLTAKVEKARVSNEFTAFRLTYSVDAALPSFFNGLVFEKTIEGVAAQAVIEAFEQGITDEIKGVAGCFMTQGDFLAVAQKSGFSAATGQYSVDRKSYAGLRKDLYTALVDEALPASRLIVVDFSSLMLFQMDGTVLPTAIHCDYLEAGMHDGNYNLDKLLELLKDDARLTFLDESSRQPGPAKIFEIPSCNADETRSRCVGFMYSPTSEEAVSLWSKMKSYETQWPPAQRFRAMNDLDVLGLRQGGAVRAPSVSVIEN